MRIVYSNSSEVYNIVAETILKEDGKYNDCKSWAYIITLMINGKNKQEILYVSSDGYDWANDWYDGQEYIHIVGYTRIENVILDREIDPNPAVGLRITTSFYDWCRRECPLKNIDIDEEISRLSHI